MRLTLLFSLLLTLAQSSEEEVLKRVKRGVDYSADFENKLTEAQTKTDEQIRSEVRGLRALMKNNANHVYGTCRLVLFAELVDFNTADENCKNFTLGTYHHNLGNLATVDNAEKNLHIRLLLRMAYPPIPPKTKWGAWVPEQWTWAGLRKIRNNTGTAWTSPYDPQDWAWHDGSNPGAYHSWMYRMPDQRHIRKGKQGCQETGGCYQNQMRVNHAGKWDDTFKHKLHPYTCDYQGRYILSNDPSHWHDAKRKCEEAGLVIAKVHTQEELNEMMVAAEYFLGPREEGNKIWNNTNWFWLGGNDFTVGEGNWTWADGQPLPHDWALPWMHPWRAPNPDNAAFRGNGTENVLAMSKWGQWDDSFASERRRAFACMCPDHTIDPDEDAWRDDSASINVEPVPAFP